jgi:hypothetical protein
MEPFDYPNTLLLGYNVYFHLQMRKPDMKLQEYVKEKFLAFIPNSMITNRIE